MNGRLFQFLSGRKPRLARLLILVLGATVLNLLSPWPLQILVDNVLGAKPFWGHLLSPPERARLLVEALVAYVLMISARGLLNGMRHPWLTRLGEELAESWTRELFHHVCRLPLAFHDRSRVGDLSARISSDVDKLKDSYLEAFTLLSSELLTFLGASFIMLRLDPALGAIALLALTPLFALFSAFPAKLRQASEKLRAVESEKASRIHETLGAVRTVKEFNREGDERARVGELAQQKAKMGLGNAWLEGQFIAFVEIASALGMAATLGYGGWRALHGSLSLGQVLVFMQYLTLLYAPVGRLSQLVTLIQKAMSAAGRIDELWTLENETEIGVERPESTGSLPSTRTHLAFRDVHFAYDPGAPVLSGLSFNVAHGERLAILGPTGCGKSTLFQLIGRFYEPDQGAIEIDGRSLGEWNLPDLRGQLAYVSQSPTLFSGTVIENIRYGLPEATEADVRRAATLAGIHDAILRFPEGYGTRVGERGATLSGGERQRIAIARALLKDSPILLLDEPTSALDAESEETVLSGLSRLLEGRTVIMITHRPRLLRLASRTMELTTL